MVLNDNLEKGRERERERGQDGLVGNEEAVYWKSRSRIPFIPVSFMPLLGSIPQKLSAPTFQRVEWDGVAERRAVGVRA